MNQASDPIGNLYMVPTFAKVGQDMKFTLGQITPDADWMDDMDDWLGTVDIGGAELAAFGFNGENWYVKYGFDADGNPLEVGANANDMIIDVNHGLVVVSMLGAHLNFAGEVVRGDTELYTSAIGNAYTGNFTPVSITLGDLVPDADWMDDMDDWLGTVDLGGAEAEQFGFNGANWYRKSDGSDANDVEILPGQGLVIVTMMGARISIPGAID